LIYESYLDDSLDADQAKIGVSAGFCGTSADWQKLRSQWNARLKQDEMTYFKTSEYKMLRGEFERFRQYAPPAGRDKAKQLRSDLQTIVALDRGIEGFGVAVAIGDYQDARKLPGATQFLSENPYHAALQEVMFQTVSFVRRLPGKNAVVFVHDDGNNFSQLHDLCKEFKRKNPKTAKLMLGFRSMDDKAVPALQLADMMANLTLELSIKWLDSGREKPKLQEMQQTIQKLGVWDKDYMMSVIESNNKSSARERRRAALRNALKSRRQ
jgi:hypothetical protein